VQGLVKEWVKLDLFTS